MIAGHLRLKNGYWQMVLSFNDETGKRVTKSVSTRLKEKGNKKQAEAMLMELRRQATAEQQCRKRAAGIYFDTYLQQWLQQIRPTLSPTTFEAYRKVIESSICAYFRPQSILISELESSHISEYYDNLLQRGVSATTVRRHHANIHKALKRAVMEGLIPSNPADLVELPQKEKYHAAFYSAEECQKLLEAIKNTKIEVPVVLTLLLGLRRSEVLGLKWEAVDFERHLIHIRQAVHQVKDEIIERHTLKRKSSHRTLPMPVEIETLLLQHRQASGYICTDINCQVISPNTLSAEFKRALKQQGLREIRYHDLRHTCAALLIAAHMPLIHVSRWLGHSSIAITADLYGHLEFVSKLECAEAITRMLEKNERNNDEKV